MKKVLLAAALLVAGASVANAEGYNRVALSYDMQHFGLNKEYTGDKSEGRNLNGFGLNYIHGFGVAENMFVEAGLSFNFGFGSKETSPKETEGEYWFQSKQKMNNINMVIPVNYTYHFNVAENFTIAPYVGINFKLNLVSKIKDVMDTNVPDNLLEDAGYTKEELDGTWVNLYNDDEKNMGGKDYTWNRFQMGWQVGVNFSYSKYVLGIQYGTDFIPAYSHKFEYDGQSYKAKVSSSALKISLGYTF